MELSCPLRIPGRAERAPAQAETEELRHSLPAQKFMQLNIFRRGVNLGELTHHEHLG